jgi:hypothetical protein
MLQNVLSSLYLWEYHPKHYVLILKWLHYKKKKLHERQNQLLG